MQVNVGESDKTIRYILALILCLAGAYFQSWWGLLAIIPLTTSLISFCPTYKIFGLSTCSRKSVR